MDEELIFREIRQLIALAKIKDSCVSCEHFDEPAELCKLAGIRPPARVIATGCKKYMEKIPF